MADYTNDPEYRDSPGDIDRETLLLLGAEIAGAGFKIPTVTVGTIALLDLIDSPFLTGKTEPALMDVFRALYVLTAKEDAVAGIMAASRATRSLEALREQGMANPDMAAGYYAAVVNCSGAWDQFDREVAVFAHGCGQFDLGDIVAAVRDAINQSTGGFAMIQAGNERPEKKTGRDARLTVNGWRKWLPLFPAWLTRRRMK